MNPMQKLKIGSKIARRLLDKILIDLRNTCEEAISVTELKSTQEQQPTNAKTGKEIFNYQSKPPKKNDDTRRSNIISENLMETKRSSFILDKSRDTRRSSTTSEKSLDQDEDDDKETKYRLDPNYVDLTCMILDHRYFFLINICIPDKLSVIRYANVRTPEQHVRTRLYFISESHIHSLMNVLRYCNLDDSLQQEDSLVCDNALERLYNTKEFDYMSYIVLRMFENTEVSLEDPKWYRIEMTFSRGANLSLLEKDNNKEAASLHQEHTLPIGSYLTL